MGPGIRRYPIKMGVTQIQNLLRLLGESAWLYPWSLAVGSWPTGKSQPILAFPALLAVLLLAAVGTQALVHVRGRSRLARAAFVALGIAVACLLASSQIPLSRAAGDLATAWDLLSREGSGGRAATAASIAIFLWWRGITVGRSRPTSFNVEDEFRTGILAMAGLLFVAILMGEIACASSGVLLISVATLVFTGLVGMPLARVIDKSERPGHEDSPMLSPGGPWLTMLLGLVGIILLVALLLAQLFTFHRLELLFEPLRGLLDALLWAIIYVVAIPVGLLISVVIYLARLILRPGASVRLEPPDMNWIDELQRQSQSGAATPELLLALKVAAAILLGLALVAILVRAVRRFSDWWDDDEVEEVRGFIATRPGLREFLMWLLRRLWPARPSILEGHERHANIARADEGIRGLYREFLVMGVSTGHGRKPPETPREYQVRLCEDATVAGADEVDLITESYNRARYAPPDSAPPNFHPVASALTRLRGLWQDQAPDQSRQK